VHIAHREDVDKESNKGDKESVSAAQPIHGEREVSVKRTDLQPRPDMVEYWLLTAQSSVRIECKVKGDNRRNSDGATRYYAYETFIA
jgi:hypothetical protein